MRLLLIVLLAMTTPGCLTALAAATGQSARTIQEALDADVAIASAIVGGVREDPDAYASAAPYSSETYGGDDEMAGSATDGWVCRIDGTEEQYVRAYSVEGARAACFMSNEVVSPNGCECWSYVAH